MMCAEAAQRGARSAGARVVHVQAGLLEPSGVRALRSARPDVVLLLDGVGQAAERTLLRNAARLARARVRAPIVLAVREPCRGDGLALLRATGRTVVATDAVLGRPGEILARPARAAVADLLAAHLICGRASATSARFRRLARCTTPFATRLGVRELARQRGPDAGAVLVVDVGAATTDVYSAVPVRRAEPRVCVTVEADLGLRTGSPGILVEGQSEELIDPVEAELLAPAVRRLAEDPWFLPADAGARAEDRRLASLAAVLAARRHLRLAGEALAMAGVGLVVLTGGVFRQPDDRPLDRLRVAMRRDELLGPLLSDCPVAVDDGFALAPAGLLVARGRRELARTVLDAAIAPDTGR
jgi:uncharacterized protein (TIGR01319 family)